MPLASIDGVRIYYEEHGRGFPLVLAYGLGGSTRMWGDQTELLARRCRLILWDPRGHGRSDSPPQRGQYGLDTSARDLLGLLDQLGMDKAYVGGHSMGGGIATRFALLHPSRVAALVIADSATASGVPMSDSMRAIRRRTIELAETEGMSAVAEYALQANPNLRSQIDSSPAARDRLRQMLLALNPTGYANTIRALIEDRFPTQDLSRLEMPTLLLVGEQDPALAVMRQIHHMISGSELVVIPSAGHLANIDQPEMFGKAIVDFLDRLPSTHCQSK